MHFEKPTPATLTARITPADLALVEAVTDQYQRASRHCVVLAALRAGLQVLQADPEALWGVLGDHPRKKDIKLMP